MSENKENTKTLFTFPRLNLKEIVHQNRKKNVKTRIITGIISWLATLIIAVPFFALAYPYMPEITLTSGPDHVLRLDHAITALIVIIVVRLVVLLLYRVTVGIFIMCLVFLSVNSIIGKYGYKDLFFDYKSLFSYLLESPVMVPFIPESASFRSGNRIRASVQPQNPNVRNFSVVAAQKYFNDPFLVKRYGQAIRYFSIFKEINSRWTYIFDPSNSEYYAPAYETIIHLSGDCDDYSITMTSCISAIGGKTRIVRTVGHLYPEVRLCKKEDFVKYNLLIRQLFEEESKGKSIYYHQDADGYIWLNLDYTGKYPGAKFMNLKIIGILNL